MKYNKLIVKEIIDNHEDGYIIIIGEKIQMEFYSSDVYITYHDECVEIEPYGGSVKIKFKYGLIENIK